MLFEEGTKPSNLKCAVWVVHPLTVLADTYRAVGDIALATETVLENKTALERYRSLGMTYWLQS